MKNLLPNNTIMADPLEVSLTYINIAKYVQVIDPNF